MRGRARHRKKALSRIFFSRYGTVRVWLGWSYGDGRSAQREVYARLNRHRIAAALRFRTLAKVMTMEMNVSVGVR